MAETNLRAPRESLESLESLALIVGAVAFVLGAVVEMFVHWGRSLEIAGRGSLGDFVAVGGAVVGVLAFVVGRVSVRRGRAARFADDELAAPGARLHWFD